MIELPNTIASQILLSWTAQDSGAQDLYSFSSINKN